MQKCLKKRKVIVDLDSNTEANFKSFHNSKLSESEYTQEYHYNLEPSPKKEKTSHLTTEVIVELVDPNGDTKPIRCLLDTGTSASCLKSTSQRVSLIAINNQSTLGGQRWVVFSPRNV
jgi:hypothetical protein